MKKIIAATILGAFCLAFAGSAHASDFVSTEKADRMFTFGVRLGANTSNRTMNGKAYPGFYHNEAWGTGFDVGAVVGINLRDYVSIQPGFFFETRTGHYALMGDATVLGLPFEAAQAGRRSSSNFTVPVMAAFKFNITDRLRWCVEAGPYVSFVLSSKVKANAATLNGVPDMPVFTTKPASTDFGFKMGTGLLFADHYYLGVHYLAGCLDAWKEQGAGIETVNFGGVTKAWTFTIGYDF